MNRIFGTFVTGRGAIGLLILRFVFGLGLMLHGVGKIQKPFSWMGDAPVPGVLQALAALSEFGGGLAILLGLLTPLASLGVFFTMLVAIGVVHLSAGHPFVAARPGSPSYESAAGYLAVALLMLITGPGSLSLDRLIFGRRLAARDSALTTDDLARA